MKTNRFEVLTHEELERIDAASMEVLAEVGIKVNYRTAREIFREAGAIVDEETQSVRLPESLVREALSRAPGEFSLYGRDSAFELKIGGDQDKPVFAGLGTPTRILNGESGEIRETTLQDLRKHIILIDSCTNIHGCQMDIWPNDILMTTIHTESIWEWVYHSRKTFGMGCYGYLPTWDMMRMMSIAAGGKEELINQPRFMAICSVVSPLQMDQAQAEGALICAEFGQPIAMSPEGIAGATSPVTLAGLLVQENAAILAHIALVQIFRPGTPVLYGTVSTVSNMRYGTVALGAPETGLITAASAQLAKYYGLPIRSVGGTTESKQEDVQAGMERVWTLLPAVLSGVNLITCAGTLDGSMMESNAMLMLDDEIAGAVLRINRGIEVNDETLGLEMIKRVGYDGNYLSEDHTAVNFRNELFIPDVLDREPFDSWIDGGKKTAIENAREKVSRVLDSHEAYEVDPKLEEELNQFRKTVAKRDISDFYLYETEEKQDLNNL